MFLEQVYSGKNQWYLYLFTILIVFVATQIGGIPLLLITPLEALATQNISEYTSTNLGLACMLFSFVTGFFALFFCVKYIHHKEYIDIVTARPKINWGRIFFSAAVWGGLSLLSLLLVFFTTDTSNIVFQFEPQNFFVLVIVGLIMFPFQTSFEELFFRGYLMQWTAFLLKYRWIALVVTSISFGLLHGANPEVEAYGTWVALPQYILMGLILGYVALKDDGLELAFGLHFANNFLSAITVTSNASALQTHALFKDMNPSASHMDTLVMLVCGVVFIWICNCKYHFMGKVNLWEKIQTPPQNNTTEDSSASSL